MRKIMTRNFKNLLLIMIVLLGTFTLVGCGDKYKYPNETPKITNPNEVFLNVGDYKVTAEQMYYRNLVSYGVDVLNELLDDILLPKFDELTAEEKAGYEEYKNEQIYLTNDLDKIDEEDKADAVKTFKKSQLLKGNFTDEEIENALKLEYRRYVFAKKQLMKDIEEFEPVTDDNGEVIQEEFFTESEINSAISTSYPDESTIILLTFRSELEAKSLMEAAGIYADLYDYRGWHKLVVDENGNKSAGELLTQSEVYDAFIYMYNELYKNQGCSINKDAYKVENGNYVWDLKENANGLNNFEFTYTELSKISSTIAKKVFESLTTKNFTKSYTIAPNQYLTKYYLAVELEEFEVEEKDSSDELVAKQLIKNKLNSTLIESYLYENRLANELVIYDRGLEILYISEYETVMNTLGLEAVYEKTSLTSGKNVATLNVNGKTVEVTADQLSKEMLSKFGVTTGVGFISQAILLANSDYNKVFNLVTGEILDQEAYDKLYKDEIKSYKEELEAGTFASIGYPKGYGWENFLRDRLGVLNELELIALGSVYTDALESLGEASYTFSNDASIAISNLFAEFLAGNKTRAQYESEIASYVADAENTIQYQMQKIVDEFYSLNAYSISVYVDLNHDDAADELTDEAKVYGELLINYFIAEANNPEVAGKTYQERLNALVKQYNLSAYNDSTLVGNVTYGELKQKGIEVSVTSTTTYNSSGEVEEELDKVLKSLWNRVKDGEFADKQFTSSTKTVEFDGELYSDFYVSNDKISKTIVISATDYVYVVNNTSSVQVLPTEELVNRYNIVNKDSADKTDEELKLSVSTREKAALQAYYDYAVYEFTGDDAVDEELVDVREELISNGTVKFADSSIAEKYQIFMNLTK